MYKNKHFNSIQKRFYISKMFSRKVGNLDTKKFGENVLDSNETDTLTAITERDKVYSQKYRMRAQAQGRPIGRGGGQVGRGNFRLTGPSGRPPNQGYQGYPTWNPQYNQPQGFNQGYNQNWNRGNWNRGRGGGQGYKYRARGWGNNPWGLSRNIMKRILFQNQGGKPQQNQPPEQMKK